QRLNVRHVPPIVTADDLSHVKVATTTGELVSLAEVARLVPDRQPLHGDAVINDGPGIMLIVEKFPWANTLDVTRGVESAMEQIKPGLDGIAVDHTTFRAARF